METQLKVKLKLTCFKWAKVKDLEPLFTCAEDGGAKMVDLKVYWPCFKLKDYKLKLDFELEHEFPTLEEIDFEALETQRLMVLTNGRTKACSNPRHHFRHICMR